VRLTAKVQGRGACTTAEKYEVIKAPRPLQPVLRRARRPLPGLLQRRIERHRERCLAADEVLPAELVTLTPTLRRELQAVRVDGEHVRLSIDLDFAFEGLVELSRHSLGLPGEA
jgi:hypothetical protein